MENKTIEYRNYVVDRDTQSVRKIVASTGFFSSQEVDVAVELVQERLKNGSRSGYSFLFAEQEEKMLGYTCFGPIACTVASYALYWIAVEQTSRNKGIGKELLHMSEDVIFKKNGGQRLYVETASRAQYESTRKFYRSCGYREEALLPDFYAPDDGKVIYVKVNS